MIAADALLGRLEALWHQAEAIWLAGGWCMPPIALTAFVMFALGIHAGLELRAKGFASVPESTWRGWIERPAAREGPIGRLLDLVAGGSSLRDVAVSFKEARATEIAPFERDLRVMKVCVGAAPLLGLLGTVTGMLATFQALSTGSGGEQTMGLVARGISEALITTETGLVVALPGVFFQHRLARRFEAYKAFLAHVETACTQSLHRRLSRQAVAA
jgi:biopolymer transport protein ExbB